MWFRLKRHRARPPQSDAVFIYLFLFNAYPSTQPLRHPRDTTTHRRQSAHYDLRCSSRVILYLPFRKCDIRGFLSFLLRKTVYLRSAHKPRVLCVVGERIGLPIHPAGTTVTREGVGGGEEGTISGGVSDLIRVRTVCRKTNTALVIPVTYGRRGWRASIKLFIVFHDDLQLSFASFAHDNNVHANPRSAPRTHTVSLKLTPSPSLYHCVSVYLSAETVRMKYYNRSNNRISIVPIRH